MELAINSGDIMNFHILKVCNYLVSSFALYLVALTMENVLMQGKAFYKAQKKQGLARILPLTTAVYLRTSVDLLLHLHGAPLV